MHMNDVLIRFFNGNWNQMDTVIQYEHYQTAAGDVHLKICSGMNNLHRIPSSDISLWTANFYIIFLYQVVYIHIDRNL